MTSDELGLFVVVVAALLVRDAVRQVAVTASRRLYRIHVNRRWYVFDDEGEIVAVHSTLRGRLHDRYRTVYRTLGGNPL